MTEDYFFGATLTEALKEVKWEPDTIREENGGSGDTSMRSKGEHTLILKQAVLGADAKDGEVNIVQVETSGFKVDNIKMPIIRLVGGKDSHVLLDLNFPDPPVALKLIQGSGPIHVAGNHVINAEQYNHDDDDDDDDLEDYDENLEEDEDEEDESMEKKKEEKGGKKRNNSTPAQNAAKKKKKNAKDD